MKYTTKIILNDKNFRNRIDFLEDIMNLEKEEKINIRKNVSKISGIETYISEMKEDALFDVIKELSNKYGNVYVSIDNNVFNDCTVYRFNTGKMVERDYFKHFA